MKLKIFIFIALFAPVCKLIMWLTGPENINPLDKLLLLVLFALVSAKAANRIIHNNLKL